MFCDLIDGVWFFDVNIFIYLYVNCWVMVIVVELFFLKLVVFGVIGLIGFVVV